MAIHPRGYGRDTGGPAGKIWRDDDKSFTIDTSGGGAVLHCADVATVDATNNVDRGDSQHLARLVVQPRQVGIEMGQGEGRVTETSPTIDSRSKDGPRRNLIAPGVLVYDTSGPISTRVDRGGSNSEGRNLIPTFGVTHSLSARYDSSEDGTGRGTPLGPTAVFREVADCLTSSYGTKWNGNASADNGSLFASTYAAVRRLTPLECERLQGFPDGYTDIPGAKDGPRYKAIGNSWAVPVPAWIGRRIMEVDKL